MLSILPPWLNIKWIAAFLGGLFLMALLWSWNERGHQVQRLADFQSGIVLAVSNATVEPDKNGHITLLKPGQIVEAVGALKSTNVSMKTQLIYIDRQSKANKARADSLDKQLASTIARYNIQYAQANKQIQFLLNRPPARPEDVCRVIEDDTNSAWDGWK